MGRSRSWRSRPLVVVLGISIGVHLVAGGVFASWKIYRYTRPPAAIFESPPPAVRVPTEAIEYRAKMQRLQKQSARPQTQVTAQVESLLNQDLKAVTSTMPSVVAPSLAGPPVAAGGARLGGGRLGGSGIGFGLSAVNFFGIDKRGEKVVFIIDGGASMVAPERGDLPGYDRVKAELVRLVGALSAGTLFNVVVFERGVDVYAPTLVAATAEQKLGIAEWMGPYWRLSGAKIEQRGTFRRNYQPKMIDWPDDGGASRLDLALIAAFEMGADLIFIITDGTPSIQRGRQPEDDSRWRDAQARYRTERAAYESSEKGKREMGVYEQERAAWQARQEKINTDRRQRGLPPVVREGNTGAPKRPGPGEPRQPTTYYTTDDLLRYARNRARELYGSSATAWPSVNVVGYSADPRGQEFIAALARSFRDGSSRNLGRFDATTRF